MFVYKPAALQVWCGKASAEDDKVEPISDASSLCQITPGPIEKDRFRTCPCFTSLDNLLITLPAYYFTESKLKKFDWMKKPPIDLEAFVGQAFEQTQKPLTYMYWTSLL